MRYILVILLMVVLSAFFSASEISFNASNKMRLKKSADDGDRAAALAFSISEDFTTALSAILIGNNLANIAASTAATVVTMQLLMSLKSVNSDGVASVVSTVVMTFIILIFGEIVPKILAKNNADRVVRFFAYPTKILTLILFPLVWLVMRLVKLLQKLWGSDDENAPTVTEEELESIIETVEEEGVIDEDKSELLQSTLDFRDTTVEEIMTPRTDMVAFDITDTEEEIAAVVNSSRFSRLPVYEDSVDNVIGILNINHYYKRLTSGKTPTVDELRSLLLEACFIHKTMRLPAALSLLRERKMHIAIIVDEFGGTMGIVTMEDILEELVGEIWDESDEIELDFVKTSENTYEVSGDMNIEDFFEEIEFDPRDFECEYTTMGGLAIEKLDSDPHVGDSFLLSDEAENGEDTDDGDEGGIKHKLLTVVVEEMDDMRVTKLTVLINRSSSDKGNIAAE